MGFFTKMFKMDLLGKKQKDSYWIDTEMSTSKKDSFLGF